MPNGGEKFTPEEAQEEAGKMEDATHERETQTPDEAQLKTNLIDLIQHGTNDEIFEFYRSSSRDRNISRDPEVTEALWGRYRELRNEHKRQQADDLFAIAVPRDLKKQYRNIVSKEYNTIDVDF